MLAGRASTPRYAVGLTRVSTAEQRQSGLGLEAQQASVRAFCAVQGWTLVAARLDRITRRTHTLSRRLEDGDSVRAADMPGADDLMKRIYAAMVQKERELISQRTRAALAAAKARGAVLGGDRGYRPKAGPNATAAAEVRRKVAEQAAHRLMLEVDRLRAEGVVSKAAVARALTERGVPAPRGGAPCTHTTVARVMARGASVVDLAHARISPQLARSGPAISWHSRPAGQQPAAAAPEAQPWR